MVDFRLSEEQLGLQRLARDFAEKEMKPVVAELDAKPDPRDCFSWDLVRKASKLGFRTMAVPPKYGGGGIDSCLTFCVVSEELSVADAAFAAAILFNGLKMAHWFELGTEEQRQKYLPPFCEDDEYLVSNSICEPEGGVDNILPYDVPGAGLRTTAVKDGDYYVINGTKIFFLNCGIEKLNLLWARTDPTVGVSKGATVFIIPMPKEGYTHGHVDDKMGGRLMINGEAILNNVRVHKSDILGKVNEGLGVFRGILFRGDNLINAARMLGIGRAVYEDSVAYAKERVQGGKPIIQHQAVALDLADIFMEVEAARAYLWYTAWRIDNRDTVPFDVKYGAMASVLCHELAVRASVRALPMWGGSGIQREVSIQRYLRDAASFLHADGGVHLKRILTAANM